MLQSRLHSTKDSSSGINKVLFDHVSASGRAKVGLSLDSLYLGVSHSPFSVNQLNQIAFPAAGRKDSGGIVGWGA